MVLCQINVGMHIYQAFQSLIARESGSKETACLTFGQFSAGDTSNIIPSTAIMQGTLRTYNQNLREKLVKRMHEIVDAAATMFAARVEGNPYPHHNPRVLFDESVMPIGAAMHAQCAFERLKNHK